VILGGPPDNFLPETAPGARQWDRGSPSGFSGPRRIYMPTPIILVRFLAGAEGSANVVFDVPTPDSRVRVKFSLLGVPDSGFQPNYLAAKTLSLWIAAYDGNRIPITDLDVNGTQSHQGAPVTIPTNAGLGGYSKEMVTAADGVQGVVTATSGVDATNGTLQLLTRYQPESGFSPSEEEWEEIKRQATPGRVGQIATVQ